jgi:hypothetical protein
VPRLRSALNLSLGSDTAAGSRIPRVRKKGGDSGGGCTTWRPRGLFGCLASEGWCVVERSFGFTESEREQVWVLRARGGLSLAGIARELGCGARVWVGM